MRLGNVFNLEWSAKSHAFSHTSHTERSKFINQISKLIYLSLKSTKSEWIHKFYGWINEIIMTWEDGVNQHILLPICIFNFASKLSRHDWVEGLKWRSSERVQKFKILYGNSLDFSGIFTHTETACTQPSLTVTQNTYCVQLCKQSNMSAMMRGSNYIHGNLCIKCEWNWTRKMNRLTLFIDIGNFDAISKIMSAFF